MTRHSLAHSLAFSALEKTIAAALAMDPVAQQRIKNLNGKVIKIHTHSPSLEVLMLFNNNGINLFAPDENPEDENELSISFDANLESTSFELIKQLLKSQNPDKVLGSNSDELIISGDTKLVEECRAIFRELDIDWEEPLSHLVGDIAAHQIGRRTRGFMRWAKKSVSTLKQDAQEYIQYESKLLISEHEFTDFSNEVAQLEQSVENLESRINKISGRH